MLKKILIANRGEIAVRIIRACRDMSIISVAVCSDVDKDSMHAQIADECLCIGKANPKNSYLNIPAIITAAKISGADAIHPGYGFLSENAEFARICEENNIVFIGPSAGAISLMGNKSEAKKTMKKAGVPIIPGSEGNVGSADEGLAIAETIGYPVMIKAANGGGGKGIRFVSDKDSFANAFNLCKSEAETSFGSGDLYIEKFISEPKHIEIQILGDKTGNVVHLFERDCSLQRRHQKIIEESPSVFLDNDMREKMGADAVKAVKAVGYENAGTIEFLVDKDKNYYFMEMNTRIQVEHPVTEMVTGIDIVREQINIASGKELSYKQEDIKLLGHAIECRINAENTDKNFAPSPGIINELNVPGGPGIRVDSAIYQGYEVLPYYDSMISKLIVFADTREQATARMRRALAEYLFSGIETNTDYHLELLSTGEFIRGEFSINFLEEYNKCRKK